MNKLHIALFCIPLAGCAGWSRPNTTEYEMNTDRAQCASEALRAYPPRYVNVYTSTPITTSCSGSGKHYSCTTMGGEVRPNDVDSNLGRRNRARDACLESKGYSFGMK